MRGGGGVLVSRFSVKIVFFYYSTELIRRGTLLCFRINAVLKTFMHRRGKLRFFLKKLSFRGTKKLRRGTLLYCASQNFRELKSSWIGSGLVRASRFRVRSVMSHSATKLRRGTLVFLYFRVSKIVRGKRGERESQSSSKLYCFTLLKHFDEESFCVVFQKLPGAKNFMDFEKGILLMRRKKLTRRLACTGISFAQLQMFWSSFANSYKQNYCFEFIFRRIFKNINSTTVSCTLCKRVSQFSFGNFSSQSAESFLKKPFCVSGKFW